MKPVEVLGVRVESPTNHPIVLLRELDGDRCVPIWIGAAEATAIAYAQQGIEPPRPLTHDLLKNVIEGLGREVTAVRVVALTDGVFHAEIVFDQDTVVESRTSDAIALALRVGCPVSVADDIIEEAGVAMAPEADDEVEKFKEFLDQVSADDFDTGTTPPSP